MHATFQKSQDNMTSGKASISRSQRKRRKMFAYELIRSCLENNSYFPYHFIVIPVDICRRFWAVEHNAGQVDGAASVDVEIWSADDISRGFCKKKMSSNQKPISYTWSKDHTGKIQSHI